MHALLADLLQVLRLERLGSDRFRGDSRDSGLRRIFGGQVLGQALSAAYATVDARPVHSLHAYFLRSGDHRQPVTYEVDRSRDGGSFSSRRVVALQNDAQILHLSASFHEPETGFDRHEGMPAVPPPEALPDMAQAIAALGEAPPDAPRPFLTQERAFEFRPVALPNPAHPVPREPRMQVWFRAQGALPEDTRLHHALLAYASDYYMLGIGGMDARLSWPRSELQMASIDHAMWFHRPMRVDEWLLYSLHSPNAAGGRGLALGRVYTRDGRLVASTAQEGLVRRRRAGAAPRTPGSPRSDHQAG